MIPDFGQRIHIWPLEPNLPASANSGDVLPPEGRVIPWSPFWQARYNDGSISLHDPRPAQHAAPRPEADK